MPGTDIVVSHLFLMSYQGSAATPSFTRGIERFSARKYFSKILQVGHFHLGFSSCKNNNEMIHSHRVLLNIVDLYLENTNETL